jgi:hypothetical protein
MPEGEIDGVRQCPVPEHNKRARCAVGLSRRRCDRTHSDTDPEATPGTESSVASVRVPHRRRGASASYIVVGGAHRGSSPQNFMRR